MAGVKLFEAFGDVGLKGVAQTRARLKGVSGAARVGLSSAFKVAAVAGVAAMAAVALAAKKAITDFVAYEQQMNEVFTLLPGISEEAMGAMSEDVKAFSREFGTLPNEVVPALYQSLSAGIPEENVFEFMAVAQRAAIGGVTELEVAVDGITSVVNAYGAETVDATLAADLMF